MKKIILALIAVGALVGTAFGGYQLWWHMNFYVQEHDEFNNSKPQDLLKLVDDRIEDKNPQFDPALADSRLYEKWQINKSSAVFKLDCPDIKAERYPQLDLLYASHADAMNAKDLPNHVILPSINLIDGAAKQFDDGLYAAIDLACYQGKIGSALAIPEFAKAVCGKLPAESRSRSFLAGALDLAGVQLDLSTQERKWRDKFLTEFQNDIPRSKPIGFYTWSDELREVWQVFRYLQKTFGGDQMDVPQAIAKVLESSQDLKTNYQNILKFYGRLTNPADVDSLMAIINGNTPLSVALFPSSTSKENELFEKAFPMGVPPSTNLMVELIRGIRNGEIDLRPNDQSGWFEHQVFALETMLFPDRGPESDKLLLTKKYKQRLLEAFKALLTKRRETHARQMKTSVDEAARPPDKIEPRLRVEPNPTFYLRTARAYSFLENFLSSIDSNNALGELHGLRKNGQRDPALGAELASIRDRFYGLYLISCEDIGLPSELSGDENVDSIQAKKVAEDWLEQLETDVDLACDTRVCVPAFISMMRRETIVWGTFGVRLALLDAEYVKPPSIRENPESPWQEVEKFRLGKKTYLIAVDEFSEFRLTGLTVLNRKEFREICDKHQTKEAILKDLSK